MRCCNCIFGSGPCGLLFIVILQVAYEPVSLHIPLHRFLSRILTALFSSHYLSKYHWFDLKAWDISPRALMEYPLRALVLASQITSAQLWVRNGASVAPSALNYVTTPICKQMRDLDILLLQVQSDTWHLNIY